MTEWLIQNGYIFNIFFEKALKAKLERRSIGRNWGHDEAGSKLPPPAPAPRSDRTSVA